MKSMDKYRGCLIGGAVGDALGYAVKFSDNKSILQRYGEIGITDYSLVNGVAKISDETQMTLFTANGLLLGKTRVMTRGIMGKYSSYISLCYKDWYRTQCQDSASDEHNYSWLMNIPKLYAKRAPESICLSAIKRGANGTIEEPINQSRGCGGIMRVAPIGLYFNDKRYSPIEVDLIGAEAAAITHGHELGYIPAAVLVHIIQLVTRDTDTTLLAAAQESMLAMKACFPMAKNLDALFRLMKKAIVLSSREMNDRDAIRQLGEGRAAAEALAIAIYCSLKYNRSFDKAVIAAVNHSGDSDTTGAVTGNIMGAYLGLQGIPKKYIEHLELKDTILEMADDLYNDCQITEYGAYHDEVWEHKYIYHDYGKNDEKNLPIFEGKAEKIRIESNNVSFYGSEPLPTDEVEQDLTIAADGQVWLFGYNFDGKFGRSVRGRTNHFSIDTEAANRILTAVSKYFSDDYQIVSATDIGSWILTITNTKGKAYEFEGSLCAEFVVDGIDLSDLIRHTLCMPDLFVFDGKDQPDWVNRIAIDYHRVTKMKLKISGNEKTDKATWDYSEQLILDRATDTLEHIQHIGSGCTVSRNYYVDQGIARFLDEFDADILFNEVPGDPPDVIEDPNETRNYRITVDFQKKPPLVLTGTYDKNGLPGNWADLMEAILAFIQFYDMGEILDPSVYNKKKRSALTYIYCSVSFSDDGRTYYYQTEDGSIEVGDQVIVPVGSDNTERVAVVEKIDYFEAVEVPFPLDRTKHIIGKRTEKEK